MKKTICLLIAVVLISFVMFTAVSYAATLDTVHVQTDKTIVRPEEEVKVTIEFGRTLGAYTFEIAYDHNLLEYVSVDGGSANNTGDKVKVTFYDATGGSNPRSNMSVIFKAKSGITTSNPTEFMVTAEGLANADASETYDDITVAMVKNITVEPEYVDYTFKLDYTSNIIKGEEKEMKLSYSSPMGRYYEHARLIAKATTPSGATVKLIGTDASNVEHDLIESGWGDAQGYKIGGKDVSQNLQLKGIFSDIGSYDITLQLIDRDNSDAVIAERTFTINVVNEESPETTPDEPETETPTPTPAPTPTPETPTKLPKTGTNIYIPILLLVVMLASLYVYNNKRK